MNNCTFIGHIGKDSEIKTTQSGKKVANLSIALKSWGDNPTVWVNLVAWEKTAEIIEKFTTKGSKIAVRCEYAPRSWDDKDGNKRWTHEFNVRDVELTGKPVSHDAETGGDEITNKLPF